MHTYFVYTLSFWINAVNVLNIIFISSQKLNVLAYLISNALRSSGDILPDPPRFSTCHKPVNPAGAKNLSIYSSPVSNSASYNGRGRFPTTDISPLRILTSCGSSSILYFLIIFPTLVIRGSFSNLTKALFFSMFFAELNSFSGIKKSSEITTGRDFRYLSRESESAETTFGN